MFHLTPQERSALAAFLTIILVGSLVYFIRHIDAKPLRWTETASRKVKPRPPDINLADARQLDKVPGIGPKTAAAIVAYMGAHGPFLRLEELNKVKGITKKGLVRIEAFYKEAADVDPS